MKHTFYKNYKKVAFLVIFIFAFSAGFIFPQGIVQQAKL